ncbi:hypothetical protein BACI349Y_590001 [Bacillus sp. 349Y]|nr:hypothetical protein BACI349Y_590001 [Bacillus sp. 349Y]
MGVAFGIIIFVLFLFLTSVTGISIGIYFIVRSSKNKVKTQNKEHTVVSGKSNLQDANEDNLESNPKKSLTTSIVKEVKEVVLPEYNFEEGTGSLAESALSPLAEAFNDIDDTKLDSEVEPYNEIRFRVAGVTKTNEYQKQIQSIIKKITKGYKDEDYIESFEGYSNREIIEYMYEGTEFEGQYLRDVIKLVPEPDNPYDENAIKVYLKDVTGEHHHIGYVGKNINRKVNKVLSHSENKIEYIEAEFTGGKCKSVEYNYEKDQDRVEVKELSRGIHINVFYSESKIKVYES